MSSPCLSSPISRTVMSLSVSTGFTASNGSPTTTTLAETTRSVVSVSCAQTPRSVRGVGWCSIVMLAPRIHAAWMAGAMSTGAPASTVTASPGPIPAAAKAPAIFRACWWTSRQVIRTGASGSPVTIPCVEVAAVR